MVTINNFLERFDFIVNSYSENTAVKCFQKSCTYRELDCLSNSIANFLTEKCSFLSDHDQKICLLFEHDVDMILGILGVIKTGNAYVPLNPSYPQDRLTYIVNDCSSKIILTNFNNQQLAESIAAKCNYKIQIVVLEEIQKNIQRPDIKINPENHIYVMYTSGSTGNPKGFIQNHKNIFHFTKEYSNILKISPEDRVALVTPYSHQVSAIDIFSTLANGATLDIIDAKLTEYIPQFIFEEKITVYHSTPSLFRYMLKGAENKNHLSTVRLVVLGGQDILRLDFDLYKEYFNDQCIFVNCFGSSEMYLASFNIINKNTEITRDSIPIGNAVKGVKIKLVNENGETPNIYEIGELIFESEYLTPGYLNFDNSSLNFNKKQSKKTCFIFKSGDLARLLPDGAIEFGGRRDNQIKIRGNRVELKEIENALNELPEIKQSIIVVEKDDANEVLLIAYCETDINQNVTESLARQYLWTKLPDYMMPSEFKFVERFPLNENGKIDFKKLVEACEKYEFFEPEGEIEEKLVAIWKEVLEIEKVSVKDSFLKLGGNSLSAIAILNRIHQIFDRYLSIRDIFMNPSIRELAGIISNVGEEEKLINDILAEIENNN